MRQQAMSRSQIDDATTSQPAADATRHFPGFVELLARQTARLAHRTRKTVEERVAGEPPDVMMGEPAL